MDSLIAEIKDYLIEYDKALSLRMAGGCDDVQVYEAESLLLGTLLKWKREHLNADGRGASGPVLGPSRP